MHVLMYLLLYLLAEMIPGDTQKKKGTEKKSFTVNKVNKKRRRKDCGLIHYSADSNDSRRTDDLFPLQIRSEQ